MKTVCPFCQLVRSRRHREPLRDFRVSLRALGYQKLRFAHSSCVINAVRAAQTQAKKRSNTQLQLDLAEILQ